MRGAGAGGTKTVRPFDFMDAAVREGGAVLFFSSKTISGSIATREIPVVVPGSGSAVSSFEWQDHKWRQSMRRTLCILLGVLFLTLVTPFPACAAEDFSTHWISGDKVSAAAKYWTGERMRNAKPYPLAVRKEIGHRVSALPDGQFPGPPGVDPGDPGENVTAPVNRRGAVPHVVSESRDGADTIESAGAATIGYKYPAPHTTFRVMDTLYGVGTTPYPYRTIGKIFFTEDGEDYECSGASIGGRAVLTAGHCVSDGAGTYHSNWIFVPSYQDGKEPYGRWIAFWLATLSEFHQKQDRARDVGFAAVRDKKGRKLSQRVGFLGFAYNLARLRHWNMFGYPGDEPWDGEFMVETQASYAYIDAAVTPNAIGIGTSQTGGCSGGPWLLRFKPGHKFSNANLANGLNSYSLDEESREIYSPYFDSRVKALKDKAVAK